MHNETSYPVAGGGYMPPPGASFLDDRGKAINLSVAMHLLLLVLWLVAAPGPGSLVRQEQTVFVDLRVTEQGASPIEVPPDQSPPAPDPLSEAKAQPAAPESAPPPVPMPTADVMTAPGRTVFTPPSASNPPPDARPAAAPSAPASAAAHLSANRLSAASPIQPGVAAPPQLRVSSLPASSSSKPDSAMPAPGAPGTGKGGEGIVPVQPPMHAHYATIRETIRRFTFYPGMAQRMGWQGTAVVAFTIMNDGRVVNLRVVESSGNQVLDRGAVETVMRAVPFPPLPSAVDVVAPVDYVLN